MEGIFGKKQDDKQWQPLEHGVMMDRHRQVIGVIGIGRGAGATFAAMGLAVKMAEMTEGVTFADGRQHEEGGHSARRLLAVDRHFEKKAAAMGSGPGKRTNIYHKVNWAVCGQLHPGADGHETEAEEPDYRTFPGKYIIVDSPQHTEDMDVIVCVVDPLPSRIMAGLETFRRIREQQMVPVIWVMNKASSAAGRREVETFLRLRFTHSIPLVEAEAFYRAEFRCTQPVFEHGMAGTDEAFRRLAEEILLHN
ncbi:MAG: hypothetical protein IKM19_07785 [Firmicutes bacterium]|nr:hypothetical protein [Bacillota bacterium]MBR6584961.1 hypothetical protein [Bacillota bacterium]